MNNSTFLTKNRYGEFTYKNLADNTKRKYKADHFMDKAIVSNIVMVICCIVDLTCFFSLFKLLSYDDKFTLAVQIIGMLFAFDVVPVFIGIQHKRLRQNLTNDRMPLYIAIGVCAAALILNVALNIMTIEMMSPDTAAQTTDFLGTTAVQENAGPDVASVAMAIFRIICPILTSFGSYFVSYSTYSPLKVRLSRTEEDIVIKRDEIRRIEASLDEYDADPDFEANLYDDDNDKYDAKKMMYRAKINSYGAYVEQRLKEHLADAKSTSALSEHGCSGFLENFNREAEAFYGNFSRETDGNDTGVNNIITNRIA